jgi:predicted DNA-binding WGR domain protein
MTGITLRRLDAACNMRRFYMLDVQPDHFGAFALVRGWGRIGRAGRVSKAPYSTETEAHAALQRQRRAKERRGYRPSSP